MFDFFKKEEKKTRAIEVDVGKTTVTIKHNEDRMYTIEVFGTSEITSLEIVQNELLTIFSEGFFVINNTAEDDEKLKQQIIPANKITSIDLETEQNYITMEIHE